jgi:RecJ-like exonuclease
MDFKPFEVSLCTQGFCLACGGTGKLRAKRKAMQFNGPPIDYDEVTIPCIACNGTGSTNVAPCSRHIEK